MAGARTSRLNKPVRQIGVGSVDPSLGMGRGFLANAALAELTNVRFIQGDWLAVEPPIGTVALVNHVTYLTRDIVPFIRKLEVAGPRRVIITVNSPPPPNLHHRLYRHVYGEMEVPIPGHESLMAVLWELGVQPDLVMLPNPSNRLPPSKSKEAAISAAMGVFRNEQWALWPFEPSLEARVRDLLESGFEQFFRTDADGIQANWVTHGREVLITWRPGIDVLV